ncbi:MAG: hypothetical protein WEK74_01360 [Hydrogenophaga sp.]
MNNRWALDDLLADLYHARKRGDLGRLAFVAYCDVRRWARDEGRTVLAEQAAGLITESPHVDRDDFLLRIDGLITQLEALQRVKAEPKSAEHSSASTWSGAQRMA